jgi:hypothetical protein
MAGTLERLSREGWPPTPADFFRAGVPQGFSSPRAGADERRVGNLVTRLAQKRGRHGTREGPRPPSSQGNLKRISADEIRLHDLRWTAQWTPHWQIPALAGAYPPVAPPRRPLARTPATRPRSRRPSSPACGPPPRSFGKPGPDPGAAFFRLGVPFSCAPSQVGVSSRLARSLTWQPVNKKKEKMDPAQMSCRSSTSRSRRRIAARSGPLGASCTRRSSLTCRSGFAGTWP